MRRIIVEGDGLFFKDDIRIDENEIEQPLNMPKPIPVLSRDELQVIYNGSIYVATDSPGQGEMKVYRKTLGLTAIKTVEEEETEYFTAHSKEIDEQKKDFIERTIKGSAALTDADDSLDETVAKTLRSLAPGVASQLQEKVDKHYEATIKGADWSAVNSAYAAMTGYQKVLLLDDKVYALRTINELVAEMKDAFEPGFYSSFISFCQTATPEQVSQMLNDNREKVHPEAMPLIRNKVWHSDRSFKLKVDGRYYVPEYVESTANLTALYERVLEREVKHQAAEGYK